MQGYTPKILDGSHLAISATGSNPLLSMSQELSVDKSTTSGTPEPDGQIHRLVGKATLEKRLRRFESC